MSSFDTQLTRHASSQEALPLRSILKRKHATEDIASPEKKSRHQCPCDFLSSTGGDDLLTNVLISYESGNVNKLFNILWRRDNPSYKLNIAKSKNHLTTNYTDFHHIGKGSYAMVFSAMHKRTKNVFAVKTSVGQFDRFNRKEAQRESDILLAIGKHQNIVHVEYVFEQYDHVFIVMEKYPTTLDVLRRCLTCCSVPLFFRWMHQVLSALEFIHSKGFIHFDVKPANILISSDNVAKLGDFGISVPVKASSNDPAVFDDGDGAYLAPETLNHYPTTKADMFALGMTILQVMSPKLFDTLTDDFEKYEVLPNHEIFNTLPKNLGRLTRALCEIDTANRIDAETALLVYGDYLLRGPEESDEENHVPNVAKQHNDMP